MGDTMAYFKIATMFTCIKCGQFLGERIYTGDSDKPTFLWKYTAHKYAEEKYHCDKCKPN